MIATRKPAALLICLLVSCPLSAADLDWLAGCWQSTDGTSKEVWVEESGDSLVGFSASVADSRIGFYEVMTLRRADDGNWMFTAYPAGQQPASFRSESIGPNHLGVANPKHDYPQRIAYERTGDRLTATISLMNGDRASTFEMTRCR